MLDFRDPALVVSRRGRPGSPDQVQTHAARSADKTDKTDKMDKPRRRVGFRKGADVDEELWPAEAFGGVSDEQFWDDLASDKPLATTARTAQQDPGPRNRLLEAKPPGGTQAVQAMSDDRTREDQARDARTREDRAREDRAREDRAREDRAREDQAREDQAREDQAREDQAREDQARDERTRGESRRGAGSGAYPESRTGPNPATERTMIQPSYAATQPVRSADATQPSETRGRRRASSIDDEDPLTSAAFSLRASGPVDGRSSRRSRDATREQYGESRPGGSRSGGPGSGSAYGATSPYPYAGTSYGDSPSVTRAMDSTPPYGENYGYGSGGSATPADDQRRPGGTGSHARHGGDAEGTRPVRRAYPQGGSQSTGSHPVGGYAPGGHQGNDYPAGGYPGNGYQAGPYQDGGYPGNGRPGSSHRAPYDPREDYRRSTHPR